MDDLKKAAMLLGQKGGLRKVPKGFSMMDPERLREISRDAVNKKRAAVKKGKKAK